MVKGVDNNSNDIIKLKGTKQNIDLNKTEGLRKTEQNKLIFEKFDKNNNGILDKDESENMKSWIHNATDNKTLSEREMKKTSEGDKNLFDSLATLGKQQNNLYGKERTYKEINGDTTTTVLESDGIIVKYDETKDADGNIVCTFENGFKRIESPSGKLLSQIEIKNGKEVKTDFEYDGNKKIATKTVDGKFSSITVSENKDGHSIETKYTSKEDFKNNKPSEEIVDRRNPALKKVTKFSYDAEGNVKAETTDSAGNVTTTYKNSKGEEIKKEEFDKKEEKVGAKHEEEPENYTVKKGETINQIVRNALKAQGIENPTKEEFNKAEEEFLELNKDLVKTYRGKRKDWQGNKYFYVNDVVQIPKFEKTEETKNTTKTSIEELKDKLQQKLGSNFTIEFTDDNKIIIKDKNGKVYQKASNFVNAPDFKFENLDVDENGNLIIKNEGQVLSDATNDKVNDNKTNEEDAETMLKEGDSDNNNQLNINEYKEFIFKLLKQSGVRIDDKNKPQVEKVIENSFKDIDISEIDGQLTKAELIKKAPEIIEKLNDDIADVLK